MKKRAIAILLLTVLLVSALTACGKNEPLTDAEVQKIVTEYITSEGGGKITDMHTHIAETDDGQVCFNVFVTVDGKSYTYQVHATTGEILSVTEGGHSH